MQADIRRLPEHIANQIAAGEVVERPASVVKELAENGLDAGSRRIDVEIKEGGREYIRVRDDGRGIPADQVLTAFERHATSKIQEASDLFTVSSLGFRGEALPSIASVSELELRTRTAAADAGALVRVEGGHIVEHRADGCPVGTTVIVRRLFFNTPARYKFLRTPAGEGRHVLDTVGRLALAHPACAFSLVTDGRQALHTPGGGNLRGAIAGVFGRHIERRMLPCEASWVDGRVHGWIAHPETHRGNRDFIVIVLNGRPIHSPALVRAIEKGYETLLPTRRFPIAVLHLELDPASVDVNVHPTKREVRISTEQDVFRQVLRAVRDGLIAHNLIIPLERAGSRPSGEGPAPSAAAPSAAAPSSYARWPIPTDERSRGNQTLPLPDFPARETGSAGPGQPAAAAEVPLDPHRPAPADRFPLWIREAPAPREGFAHRGDGPFPSGSRAPRESPGTQKPARRGRCAGELRAGGEGGPIRSPIHSSMPPAESAEAARAKLRELHLVGSLDQTFWIGLHRGELWVIDQHVAHERVLYEQFLMRREALESTGGRQQLLHPWVLELSAAEAEAMHQQQRFLNEAGFSLEPFGPQAFRLLGVPASLSGVSIAVVEEALRENLHAAETGADPREAALRDLAARLACRMSIKAGERVPLEQGRLLLQRLAEADNPFTCPHGRPIVLIVSREELERRFLRQ